MKYGLIGERLGHSFSKEIHGAIGDYPYELKELRPCELESFMTEKDFLGINVTIPYKVDVMKYLDIIDEGALSIGAVNTVVNRDGVLFGYNTDLNGMTGLIKRAKVPVEGAKVLILGTGGTSRTAEAAARLLGASTVIKAGRTARKDNIDYDEAARSCRDTEVIINTTPAGMFPNTEGMATDIDAFPDLKGIIDAVYNPLRTDLVLRGQERGIPSEGGLYMLASQAVFAAARFFGTEPDEDVAEAIYNDICRRRENIVLTGMPGCGKTTTAGILADHLSMEMIDTDLAVKERTGRDAPSIIREDGIEAFRDIEEDVIKEISLLEGRIIATGGGSVLRKANIRRLKRNGRIYFLDRDPSATDTGGDRPLSKSREDIDRLCRERYPLYTGSADRVIKTGRGDRAEDILKYFKDRKI